MRKLAAEPRFGRSGRGPERGRIAGAPRLHLDRHGSARDALDRRHDIPDRITATGAEVERVRSAAGQQFAQRPDVGVGEVGDVARGRSNLFRVLR